MAPTDNTQTRTAGAVSRFKTRVNARGSRGSETPEEALLVLRNVRKPLTIVFVILGLFSVGLDVLDLLETEAAVTIILFIVQAIVEIGFFLLVRSLLNRGQGVSFMLLACFVAVLFASLIPVVGPFISLLAATPIVIFGVFNKNVKVIDASKDNVLAYMDNLERGIRIARQNAARLIRFGRSSPRLRKATRAIVRSKRFRTLSRGSRTTKRFAAFTVAEILPLIEYIPFHLIGIVLTYRDQLRTFTEAQELITEYEEAQTQLQALDAAIAQEQFSAFVTKTQNLRVPQAAPRQVGDIAPPATPPGRVVLGRQPTRQLPEGPIRTAPKIRDVTPAVPVAA